MAGDRSGPGDEGDLQSAVRAVARTLREQILSLREDGVFLGSEEELLVRLGTSRPTLRQAARLLEHENLLAVRRGAAGGFFSRLPTAGAVSHVASVYLRSRRTSLGDLNRAAAVVVPEIARLAAQNPSASERASLLEFADAPSHRAQAGSPAFLRDVVQGFGRRLVALIDNPPLALFYEMLLDLAVSPFPTRVLDDPARARRVLRFHHELGEAVKRGDGVAAAAVTEAYYATADGWLRQGSHPG
jgi:DNA-binding FadR family transcriptional regulator